jgi:transketolase
MLLYALPHLNGYPVSLDDLKAFRQWGSNTPGHPECFMTAGVEATTGPLGQGTANGVGMAIAERALAHRFNRPGHTLVDHHTYVLAGDGDLMEGLSGEAASLAGHLHLGKLIMLYDSNAISLDGPTDLAFTEEVAKRYEAYGWQVLHVADGDRDLGAIDEAITAAKAETDRPSLIVVTTTIGFGSPNKQGTSGAHGSPLGEDEVALTKQALGWTAAEPFTVPAEVQVHFNAAAVEAKRRFDAWSDTLTRYRAAFPDDAQVWDAAQQGKLPDDLETEIPPFETGAAVATRASSGAVLNALAKRISWLIGGDADLSCSTKTLLKDDTDFEGRNGSGRNIRYGVREHAMGAVANGICYHGGLKTFTATFFCFADYMRPAMRLASLSKLAPIFVFTHDSIAVGEDGPTHQPVEHLASLRAMPNHLVIRPADAAEVQVAWRVALEQDSRPTSLVFSRQKVTTLDREAMASAQGLRRGAYILAEAEGGPLQVVLIATGAEIGVALETRTQLQAQGTPTRVVSMPCWELFAEQDEAYRQQVLPTACNARVAIEAACSFGWERWVGPHGRVVGIDRFGASAPGGENLKRFGFNADHIAATARGLLS